MLAPAGLGLPPFPAHHDHIVGPIVAALGIISLAEVTRGLRWAAFLAGLWLIFAPFVLGSWSLSPSAAINDALCGVVICSASVFRGRVKQKYGGGWRELWRSDA